MTKLSEYQAAFNEAVLSATQGPSAYQNNVGAGVDSQWFSGVPRVPGENLMGFLVTLQSTLSATSGTATSVSGAVNLDVNLNYVQVASAPGGQLRSYSASRLATQEVERLVVGTTSAVAYPGTTVASIASAATAAITNVIFIPCGGQAGALKIHTAPTTQAYGGTAPVVSTNIWVRSISSPNETVVTFEDNFTASLSSGANVDISAYMPVDITADWIDIVGVSAATTQVLGITAWGADGSVLEDVNGGEATTLTQMQKYIGPANTSTVSTVWSPRKQLVRKCLINLGTAQALEILSIAIDGGKTAQTPVTPGTTPVPNAANLTGKTVNGGQVVLPANAGVVPGPATQLPGAVRRF